MVSGGKRRVIVVTDGDAEAKAAVAVAARNIGATCLLESAGNPTHLSGEALAAMILGTAADPVVVMLDDKGQAGLGPGEKALKYLVRHPQIEIIGVVAVAADVPGVTGIKVTASVDQAGHLIEGPVDKNGHPEPSTHHYLEGDTVEYLSLLPVPVVIGTGDTGKMHGADRAETGAAITTKALKEVLRRANLGKS
ncbi:MAG: stage V sporulation protein AE [Heliobacteriaceae bacterium]|nr:stage V sporulation protein AE [Heliobacteriaceae bacterium]MDD4587305.1 stage V sporulation protein AE [Heliobacteriaceae bacterium]